MAQGKIKVKTKVPETAKSKVGKKKKGTPFQRRGNAPIQSRKEKFNEAHKLKKVISKTVNKQMEDELRETALEGKKSLVKKNTMEK